VQSLLSDPIVEFLSKASSGATSRQISEATGMPMRRVQKRVRALRDARIVDKQGHRYSVIRTVSSSPPRPPDSVRRPRSLSQVVSTLLADIDETWSRGVG
jgi:hypothetical protein